jgi:hypothetical protein
MKKMIYLLVGLFSAATAYGGDALSGMLSQPHFMSTGLVLVTTDGQRLGTPNCALGSPYRFVIDATTTAGKVQLAGLLAAHATGKPVRIVGTGNCSLYSDSETISYFYIVD